ncbi:MAG: glycine cleavage system protein GcvH [Verrucomicrobiota bacterium]
MMSSPDQYKYSESHEWIDIEGTIGTVGITDHAQNELSDVVYVELPEIGKEVAAGDAIAVVESVKAASDIYAPVSGKVTEVNDTLGDDPALVNTGAFTEGWLFKIEVSNADEAKKLLSADAYKKHIS